MAFSTLPTYLNTLATRVRQRADMPDTDGLVSDSELYGYINGSYMELVDLLMQRNEDAFTAFESLTGTSPLNTADLLHLPTDIESGGGNVGGEVGSEAGFTKIRRIEWQDGSEYIPLERVGIEEWDRFGTNGSAGDPRAYTLLGNKIHILPAQSSSRIYRVFYVRRPLELRTEYPTNAALPDQIVLRWDDYIVIDAAIKCLRKEEQDVSELLQEKAAMQMRIATSMTDRSGPARVAEVRRYDSEDVWDWWY